jgi:hypothetical protein
MAYTDREDLNYLGVLYNIGNYATPFLTAIGLNQSADGSLTPRGKISRSFQFPVAQPWSLSSASQNTQSEATAAAAGTATTYTRAQDYNVAQIMKYDASVTYAKQGSFGEFSGIQVLGDQPVSDELAFQQEGAMRQMAIDIDYSFLQGTFVDSSGAATNQTTRGIIEATSTNAVAAGSTPLTKALMDELLRTMAAAGAVWQNPVIFVNAFQKQQLSDIYGYAPEDRNVGGLNIKQIETDFAMLGVVYAPNMTTSVLEIADIAFCQPVFVPHEGGQLISWTDIGRTAAQAGGFFYTQIGLDYGPEEYHGKITGLTTS